MKQTLRKADNEVGEKTNRMCCPGIHLLSVLLTLTTIVLGLGELRTKN